MFELQLSMFLLLFLYWMMSLTSKCTFNRRHPIACYQASTTQLLTLPCVFIT